MASCRTPSFNDKDQNQLREINKMVKSLRDELAYVRYNIKSELTACSSAGENNQLKQALKFDQLFF